MEGSNIQDGNLCLSTPTISTEIINDVPTMDEIQMVSGASMDEIQMVSGASKREGKPINLIDSEIESSKSSWSEPFDDRIRETIESNKDYYRLLQKKWGSDFFQHSNGGSSSLDKIAEGGQAEIFHARKESLVARYLGGHVFKEWETTYYVLKVFKEGFSLQDLEKQWPHGMLKNQHKYNLQLKTGYSTQNCCQILGATLLENGRFAFLMKRYLGDLRKAIDCKMQYNHYQSPPFTITEVGHIVVKIAWGMRELHKNNIVHGDLKASNVLIDGPLSSKKHPRIDCTFDPTETKAKHWKVKVADFECSVGVVGTTYWRAPEILQAVQDRNIQPQIFIEKVDVYGFAMTCYEVLTGRMPFEELNKDGTQYIKIIQGRRPKLPEDMNPLLRTLLSKCWHGDPSERPSFKEITKSLREIFPFVYVPRKWIRTSKRMMTSCEAVSMTTCVYLGFCPFLPIIICLRLMFCMMKR